MMFFHVGYIVKVKRSIMNEPENVLAFVYEEYGDFDDPSKMGISIITENGVNLGGFSFDEQQLYLEYYQDTRFKYKFQNVIKLRDDFNNEIKELFG